VSQPARPSLSAHRRAFPNARALAKEGAAKQLVDSLRGHAELPAEAVAALATALKQIAANEEICQEVAGAGGVQLALQILETGRLPAAARDMPHDFARRIAQPGG
jgi:hypothetical protein